MPEQHNYDGQPPSKMRKLNSSRSRKRKRKLPSFMTKPRSKSSTSTTPKNTRSTTRSNTATTKKRIISNSNSNSNQNESRDDVCDPSLWSTIAVTSLSTIFEFVDIKFLYFSAVRVCRNWHSTVCGDQSDFVFGYYRKSMRLDPAEPLSLDELKAFTVPMIKQELKERSLSVKGRKSVLMHRLSESIKKDGLQTNIKNPQSKENRKRLILFQMKQMFRIGWFCQNCHFNREHIGNSCKNRDAIRSMWKLTELHFGIRVCTKCRGLKEYQDVNAEEARNYFLLKPEDITQCGVQWRRGWGQTNSMSKPCQGEYINAHVALEIAKMKHGKDFKRRSCRDLRNERNSPMKKRSCKASQAVQLEFEVDRSRMEHDEVLYNATLPRT